MNKVNNIARKIGLALMSSGEKMIKSAFDLTPVDTTASEIRKILDPNWKQVYLDNKYKIISWVEWREIDSFMFKLLKRKYQSEYFDCDDFAYINKYWTLKIFGISQFIIHGHIYNLDGQWKGGHFWNAKCATDGNIYFYEPIYGNWVKWQKGQKTIIKMRSDMEYGALATEL